MPTCVRVGNNSLGEHALRVEEKSSREKKVQPVGLEPVPHMLGLKLIIRCPIKKRTKR